MRSDMTLNRHNIILFLALVLAALPGILKAQNMQNNPLQDHSPPLNHLLYRDDFLDNSLTKWHAYGAGVSISSVGGSPALQTQGDSQVFWDNADDPKKMYQDVTVEGDVSVDRNNVNSGFIVRADKQTSDNSWSGYWASIRRVDAGYAVVQLFRFPNYALLQEARIKGAVSANSQVHLKVTCQGPNIWVWANGVDAPAITEYDDTHTQPGFIGFKAENNKAFLSHVRISEGGKLPRNPYIRDWSKVKGAVFITSESVNSYQMWDEHHPAVIDRELSYAHTCGLNTVQVYLDFLNWQKDEGLYLSRIEDFLHRADQHRLKVTFIFFDDVGSVEPPHLAPYHPPVPGVHNSQMQGCPGRDIIDHHYGEHQARLKRYIQSVVEAHKSDPRILFWQTYNEPSHVTTLPLLADSYAWIKETGSSLPVTATGGGAFYGSYYSDFPSFHSYLDPHADPAQGMVLADGGPEHLCTETLDRPGVGVPKLVHYFGSHHTGWILWELMIGRDNCRFPWGSQPGAAEPVIPFHGLVYPDGHSWSVEDVQAIRGQDLDTSKMFRVEYFSGAMFEKLEKTSLVSRIDFDLDAEPGTAASDASAGVSDTQWSNRYTGILTVPRTGIYTFFGDTDGSLRVLLNGKQVLGKTDRGLRRQVSDSVMLNSGKSYNLVAEYAHGAGSASLHLEWSDAGGSHG